MIIRTRLNFAHTNGEEHTVNSLRLLPDTSVWQRSLLGQPHWTCPAVLEANSTGMALPDVVIWEAQSCVRQLLWAACSGYTPSLAMTLDFPSRSL